MHLPARILQNTQLHNLGRVNRILACAGCSRGAWATKEWSGFTIFLNYFKAVRDFLEKKIWEGNTWLSSAKRSSTAANCSSKHSSKWPIRVHARGDGTLDVIAEDSGAASCVGGKWFPNKAKIVFIIKMLKKKPTITVSGETGLQERRRKNCFKNCFISYVVLATLFLWNELVHVALWFC